jgi:hypothetical protein
MSSRLSTGAASLATLAVWACASEGTPADGNWAPVQQEYRMGSRIPVRERSPTLTKEERQRQADEAADELRRMQRVSGAPAQGGF